MSHSVSGGPALLLASGSNFYSSMDPGLKLSSKNPMQLEKTRWRALYIVAIECAWKIWKIWKIRKNRILNSSEQQGDNKTTKTEALSKLWAMLSDRLREDITLTNTREYLESTAEALRKLIFST